MESFTSSELAKAMRVHVSRRIYYGRRQVDKLNMEISVCCRGSLFRGESQRSLCVFMYMRRTHTHSSHFISSGGLGFDLCARTSRNFSARLLAPNKIVGPVKISRINWLAIAWFFIARRRRTCAWEREKDSGRRSRRRVFCLSIRRFNDLDPAAWEHCCLHQRAPCYYFNAISSLSRASGRKRGIRSLCECRPLITLYSQSAAFIAFRDQKADLILFCVYIHAADERGKNGSRLM